MRDRHFPRLCRTCHVPMARQEDVCWHCGARWASEDVPQTTLQVIAGDAPTRVEAAHATSPEADRWINEGGSVEAETPLRAAAGRT